MSWNGAYKFVTLPFVLIGGIQIGYWVLDRSVPVTIVARAIEDLSVPPGGNFEYTTFFRRSKYCDATVDRWLVESDGSIHDIDDPPPGTMRTRNLNIIQRNDASIPIPNDMKPGETKSCYKPTWKCNAPQRWGILPPIVGPEVCQTFLVTEP
jgi:hypothetical protein